MIQKTYAIVTIQKTQNRTAEKEGPCHAVDRAPALRHAVHGEASPAPGVLAGRRKAGEGGKLLGGGGRQTETYRGSAAARTKNTAKLYPPA